MKKEKSFQDYFPGNGCAGCGPANKTAHGHRIKARWGSKPALETICEWKPALHPACRAGRPGTLHGGCAISLMDCNSIWTAIAARYEFEGRPFGSKPIIYYVTAGLKEPCKFIRPLPLDADHLTILSKVMEMHEKSGTCVLYSEIVVKGIKYAETGVIAVRVKPDKKENWGWIHPTQKK